MKRVRKAYMKSDPWLEALGKARGADWLERRLGSEATIDGIRVRVDELTGAAGDVIIGHPWLLHAPAPNPVLHGRDSCVSSGCTRPDRRGAHSPVPRIDASRI